MREWTPEEVGLGLRVAIEYWRRWCGCDVVWQGKLDRQQCIHSANYQTIPFGWNCKLLQNSSDTTSCCLKNYRKHEFQVPLMETKPKVYKSVILSVTDTWYPVVATYLQCPVSRCFRGQGSHSSVTFCFNFVCPCSAVSLVWTQTCQQTLCIWWSTVMKAENCRPPRQDLLAQCI